MNWFKIAAVCTLLLCGAGEAHAGGEDTAINLNAGVLTITDVSTVTADNLAISYAGGTYTVTDVDGAIIESTVPGSTGGMTSTVTVPDAGVTGIRIVLNDGDDAVVLNSVQASLSDEFSAVGGMGADSATLNAALTTPTTVTIDVEAISVSGDISSSGDQVFAGAVALGADVTFTSAAGIAFSGSLDGAQALVVDAATLLAFSAAVGNTTPLTSIDGSAATIAIAGGAMRTTGAQSYASTGPGVRVEADATFESTGNELVSFPNALFSFSGEHDLIVTGQASFGFQVGLDQSSIFRPFNSVVVNGSSNFGLAGTVLTTGSQTYDGPVGVATNQSFRSTGGGDITFNSSLDSTAAPADVTILTTGNAHFVGTVGANTGLDNLSLGSGAAVVNNVSFDRQVSVVANLFQNAGAGTTTFNGVSAGGLALTTANVVSASGSLDYAGTATVVSDLALTAGSQLPVTLNGTTPGVDFDQLSVTGTVDLGGATLDLSLMAGFVPSVGDEFVLIDNDGVDPVLSSFANGIVSVDGLNFVATNTGGDGNDVVLTVVGMPPAALIVDTLNDESDGDFGVGDLSLREALQLANLDPDLSTVSFDPALTAGGAATITLTLGEIAISQAATLTGPGAALLTVSGNNSSRVFRVDNGDNNGLIDVAISDLQITAGLAAGPSTGSADRGGAVFSYENLTLTNVALTNSTANRIAGAVYSLFGVLSIDGSSISGNSALSDSGGAISLAVGSLILRNSVFSMNSAGESGGAVETLSTDSVTIDNIQFVNNTAGKDGGAVFSRNVDIRHSLFEGNTAGEDGGGIYLGTGSPSLMEDTEFRSNTAGGSAGGAYVVTNPTVFRRTVFDSNNSNGGPRGGGALYLQSSTVRIEDSQITNNTAGSRNGGGIMKLSGNLVVANTTISGNTAQLDGGGIYSQSNPTTIINSTIVRNTANDDGGGVWRLRNAVLLRNSIVSGNNANDDGDEIWGDVTADGNNLLGRNNRNNAQSFASGFNPGPSDITATSNGTNPTAQGVIFVNTLADNGGPTLTHLLPAGSPAIDGGDGSLATSDGTNAGTPLINDQRLLPRFFGSGVDIGAVQLMAATTEVRRDGSIAVITDTGDAVSADELVVSYSGGTYTVTDSSGLTIRNDAIAGGTGNGTSAVTFPETGITGVRLDTRGGDDRVTINSLPASLVDGVSVLDSDGTDETLIDSALSIGSGPVQIGSESIGLRADIITTGSQLLGGAVEVIGDRTLSGSSVFIAATVNPFVPSGVLQADFHSGELKAFDEDGAFLRVFASGLSGPRELARNSDGAIFVIEQGRGQIQAFTANGQSLGVFAADLQAPYGIAIDGADRVYVSEPALGRVLHFDRDGNRLGVFREDLPSVSGLAVGQVAGEEQIAVVYDNQVEVFALDGNSRRRLSDTQVSEPSNIQLIQDGAMLLADGQNQIRFDADGAVSIEQTPSRLDGLPIALPSGAQPRLTINATAGDATIAGSVGNLEQLSALSITATGAATLLGMDVGALDITAAAFSALNGVLNFELIAAINAPTTLSPVSTLQIYLDGDMPGINADQVDLVGSLDLDQASLLVEKSAGFNPVAGDEFLIINNDGVDPVVNRFASSLVSSNGTQFAVFYDGGDGNDVVLCVTGPGACPIASAAVSVTETDGSTQTAEGAAADSFELVLEAEPYAAVNLNLTVPPGLLVAPTNLVFDPQNWMTPQSVSVSAIDDRIVEGNLTVTVTQAISGGGYDAVMVSDVTVDVADNDSASYRFASASAMEVESVGTVSVPVLVDFQTPGTGPQAFTDVFTIPISIDPASSANAMDFVSLPSSILMPANGSSRSVSLSVVDDNFAEPTESLILVLGDETGGTPGQQALLTIGSQPDHVFTILDDDTVVDLAVSNTLMPTEALPGTGVSFEITVNNLSTTADVPQAAFAFVMDVPLDNVQWTCIAEANATCPAGGNGLPAHDIALGRSTGVMYTLTATVPAGASPGDQFVADASINVAAPQLDPNAVNDSATATLTVQGFMIFADGFEEP